MLAYSGIVEIAVGIFSWVYQYDAVHIISRIGTIVGVQLLRSITGNAVTLWSPLCTALKSTETDRI